MQKSTEIPTVHDIARTAGVSLATVDRVLNNRAGVRKATVEKVNRAINDIGYVRDSAAAGLARKRYYRLLFILPETENEFVLALKAEIEQQKEKLKHLRTEISLIQTTPFEPESIVQVLDSLKPGRTDGVAVFGPDTQQVRDAVNRAKEKGIAVMTLVADLSDTERDHFVGINNISAGSTAAKLLGRFVGGQGKVLVVTGSPLARDHMERCNGFEDILAQDFPNLTILPAIEGQDDPELIRSLLPEIFDAHPDICGIYASAAGNSGVTEFLTETNRAGTVTVIAHELTSTSRSALEKGTIDAIISQDTGHLVRSATRLLKSRMDNVPFDPTQERIGLDIYLRENLPPEQTEQPRTEPS